MALGSLALGAAGGAIAALVVIGLLVPGSGGRAPSDGNGKIATALEELEKQGDVSATRPSEPDPVMAELGERLTALEQKLSSLAGPSGSGGGRFATLEQKLEALEAAQARSAGQQSQTTSPSRADAITAVNQRLDALEQRLARSSQHPGALASLPRSSLAPQADAARDASLPPVADQVPTPPAPIPEPPRTAPAAPVRGWALHNVTGGVAVLEGRNTGIIEVREGQQAPGLGRILRIERRGGIWVVATEKGVITAPVY